MSKRNKKKLRRRMPGQMRRFSLEVMSSGKGPNRAVVAEYHERTKSLAISAEEQAIYDIVFPGAKGTPAGKHDINERSKQLKREGQFYYHFLIYKTDQQDLRLFFNPDKTLWRFLERRLGKGRISDTYGNKDVALSQYDRMSITWRAWFPLPKGTESAPPALDMFIEKFAFPSTG